MTKETTEVVIKFGRILSQDEQDALERLLDKNFDYDSFSLVRHRPKTEEVKNENKRRL